MYISADLNTNAQTSGTECLYAKPQKTKMATMTSKEKLKGPQQTGDVYATVNKVQKKGDENMYTHLILDIHCKKYSNHTITTSKRSPTYHKNVCGIFRQ